MPHVATYEKQATFGTVLAAPNIREGDNARACEANPQGGMAVSPPLPSPPFFAPLVLPVITGGKRTLIA